MCTFRISSALSAIPNVLHSSGTQFVIDHYHTTAYIVGLVPNLASWERDYANCNSTYLVKASTLSGMRLQLQKQLFEVGYPNEQSPSLLLGSRIELHPLAHAQFASWNSAQRLSPKKVASDKNSSPGLILSKATRQASNNHLHRLQCSSFPPEGVTGTSGYRFEYYLHLIKFHHTSIVKASIILKFKRAYLKFPVRVRNGITLVWGSLRLDPINTFIITRSVHIFIIVHHYS